LIWHFFEVWLALLIAFGAGCVLGAYLYGGIARSPLAAAQGVVADRVGDAIDEIKARLGIGPDWRPVLQPAVERPSPKSARPEPPAPEALPLPAIPPSWSDEAPRTDDTWDDDATWADDERSETSYSAELKAAAAEGLAESAEMMRPAGLSAPRSGVPDNLQRIRGIGRRNEELLHSLGIFHFGQIAAWTPAEARWIAAHLKFPERIERDDWIGQATILASGGMPLQEKDRRRREDADEYG
jgi:predicted flap endonuclease-1-like 5' DNA nuclease